MQFADRCLPMGATTSCKTYETFSTAIEWIAQQKLNIEYIMHLLDDFLLVVPSYDSCAKQLDRFLQFCSAIGLPMAPEKTCGPSTTLSSRVSNWTQSRSKRGYHKTNCTNALS